MEGVLSRVVIDALFFRSGHTFGGELSPVCGTLLAMNRRDPQAERYCALFTPRNETFI
jgi:hypothetical protein